MWKVRERAEKRSWKGESERGRGENVKEKMEEEGGREKGERQQRVGGERVALRKARFFMSLLFC